MEVWNKKIQKLYEEHDITLLDTSITSPSGGFFKDNFHDATTSLDIRPEIINGFMNHTSNIAYLLQDKAYTIPEVIDEMDELLEMLKEKEEYFKNNSTTNEHHQHLEQSIQWYGELIDLASGRTYQTPNDTEYKTILSQMQKHLEPKEIYVPDETDEQLFATAMNISSQGKSTLILTRDTDIEDIHSKSIDYSPTQTLTTLLIKQTAIRKLLSTNKAYELGHKQVA